MKNFRPHHLIWSQSFQVLIMSKLWSSKSLYTLFETDCLLTTNRRCLMFNNIFVIRRELSLNAHIALSSKDFMRIFQFCDINLTCCRDRECFFLCFCFFQWAWNDNLFVAFQCSNKFLFLSTFASNSFDRWIRFRGIF